jgi:hypothetical protein
MLPRRSISTLMVVVAVVAIDIASLRAYYASRGPVPGPQWQALLLGVPLISVCLQYGLFRLIRDRGRGRSFWFGFEVSGSVVVCIFISTFAFLPSSMDFIICYGVAYYYELISVLFRQPLRRGVLGQYAFLWWLADSILLFLPQLLIALSGGLLWRLVFRWKGRDLRFFFLRRSQQTRRVGFDG